MLTSLGRHLRDGWSDARGHGFWLGPQLTREVREQIARRLYRVVWIPLILLVIISQASILATVGLREPTRFIPGAIWLTASLVAREVARRRSILDGLAIVVLGHVAATTIGVLAHSVHAPAYWMNILALAVIVPIYGARAGILLTIWCALSGAAWFVLHRLGLTVGLLYPNSVFAYVFLVCNLLCGVVLMAIPAWFLAAALRSSEQRRLETAVAHLAEQDSELRFRAVFEQTGALTLLVEPDGTIIRLNLSGEQLLGLDGARCVGQTIFDLPWIGLEAEAKIEQALLRATQGTERLKLELMGPTGRRHLQLAIAPVNRADGTLRSLVVAGLDATRLLEAERDLAHARRLEALGQLAGGVAHDFNNMLLAAQGSLESVRSGRASEEERLEALESMDQAMVRAAKLTRKLLAFGRRDRFEKQVVDLGQLIKDATQLYRRTIGASIDLVVDLADAEMPVEGDAAAIEHVLMNLVVNAREAMPRGGSVTLRTRVMSVDEAWCKEQTFPILPGRIIELCVEDDGLGMSDEVRVHAFEPFFTTKVDATGSGLGLAAAHGTMLSHGGGITVESQPGQGTRFKLFFPVAEQRLSARVPPSGVGHSLRLSGKILVVDDEPLVLRVTKRSLEALGVTAVLVSDAATALAALNAGQQFDCVLTDVVMPKMSGIALVERLRKIRPSMPIVVMSGFPAGSDGPAQEILADYPWLRKPFSRNDLSRVLGPILNAATNHQASLHDG